jgi:hypothetical protein
MYEIIFLINYAFSNLKSEVEIEPTTESALTAFKKGFSISLACG